MEPELSNLPSPSPEPPADATARADANRANARLSTGPKTAAGKAIVARNSIGHGIYAQSPVVAGLESAKDWEDYRQAMLASLGPQGMLEETLTERIILTAWRLRRTVRYETGRICSAQEGASEAVARQLYSPHQPKVPVAHSLVEAAQNIWNELQQREIARVTVATLRVCSDDTLLPRQNAKILLANVYRQLGKLDVFEAHWKQLPDQEAWTAGVIRNMIQGQIKPSGKPLEEFLRILDGRLAKEFIQKSEIERRTAQGFVDFQRAHLLPDTETLEKVMRYESHLSRQLHRDLHELERLQARRHGQLVAAPVVLDVDVAGAPNLPQPQ